MLCLHEIKIEYEDYIAQLDFVIISNKYMAILETKKLNGDITINRDGDFIRTIRTKGGKVIKEGIYSPVSQNQRHINIVKNLLSKKLSINKLPLISLVVIANPKSIIDKEKCPKDIKYSIYKYDQIVKQLEKHKNDKKNEYNLQEKYMSQIANLLVEMKTSISFKSIPKYGITEEDLFKQNIENATILGKQQLEETKKVNIEPIIEPVAENPIEFKTETKKSNEQLIESLKKYRLETCKKENVAAYFVFNNAEMEDLIEKYHRTKEELLEVKGFGENKFEKYERKF